MVVVPTTRKLRQAMKRVARVVTQEKVKATARAHQSQSQKVRRSRRLQARKQPTPRLPLSLTSRRVSPRHLGLSQSVSLSLR